jgi:cyanophycin synthetase
VSADDEAGPRLAFEDSRRLTGPNRWSAGTAVVLTPLDAQLDVSAWEKRVREVAAALGWTDPQPVAQRHAHGLLLAFAAPEAALFTATEINEWACEQSSSAAFERLHTLRTSPADHFAARAAAERSRPLQRLLQAAAQRDVPAFVDDDALTLGAGNGGRTCARAALPLPMDVPWAALHDIPKALVTGSNGKTTTVRLIAAMARAAGERPGLCSTEGVSIDGAPLQRGDWSGPAGARAVLSDARVTIAVLETARGGIARRGLAVSQAEVAVVTNLSADHFGEHGIDSLDDLAELKLVVARAVTRRGLLVLNADDAMLMAAADRLPHARDAQRALFAADADHPTLVALRAGGGATCGVRRGELVLEHAGGTDALGSIERLPLTFHGAAPYNLMNLAAAALAAHVGLTLSIDAVRATAQSFGRDARDNPGRLEQHAWRGATVLIDYAHNPDGLARLLAAARALPRQRLLLLLGQAGNRSDAAIAELARVAAAAQPDFVVLKELPHMLRGRVPGDVPALLRHTLQAAGRNHSTLLDGGDEPEAALRLLDEVRAGDVAVLPLHSEAGRAGVSATLRSTFSTARLVMRPFRLGDAAFIVELLNDPDWLRFIGDRGVRTLDDARTYLHNGPIAHAARHGFALGAVLPAGNDQPIGMCGLVRREGLDDVDLGYAFMPSARGHGYAHEAAAAWLARGFGEFGLKRIVAITKPDNAPSQRVLESIGMRFERRVRLPQNREDSLLYAIER